MNIAELFSPGLTCFCKVGITNKKKALEKISKLISAHDGRIKYQSILDSLQQREKIGNTVLGHNIALPHARVSNIKKPYCVVLALAKAINFSSTEIKNVDLIFGLIVPKNYVEAHLQLLSKILTKLQEEKMRESLRQCNTSELLYQQLVKIYEYS